MKNKMNFFTKKRESNMGQFIKYILFIVILTVSIIGSQNAFAAEITNFEVVVSPNILGKENNVFSSVIGTELGSVQKGYISFSKTETGLKNCNLIEESAWKTKESSSTNTKLVILRNNTSFLESGHGSYKIKTCLKDESGNITETGTKDIYINSDCRVTSPSGIDGNVSFSCPECDNKNISVDFLSEEENLRIQTYPDVIQNNCLASGYSYKYTITQNDVVVFNKAFDLNKNHFQNYLETKGDYCETGSTDCITCSVIGKLEIIDPNNSIGQVITSDPVEWNCKDNNKIKEMWEDEGGGGISTNLIKKCKDSLALPKAVTFDQIDATTRRKSFLKINTKECKSLSLVVKFQRAYFENFNTTTPSYKYDVVVSIDNGGKTLKSIDITPTEDLVTFDFLINDDSCFAGAEPECTITTRISIENEEIFSSLDKFIEYNTEFLNTGIINPEVFNHGVIMTNCSGSICNFDDWILNGITGVSGSAGNPATYVGTKVNYDEDSPCYKSSGIINPNTGKTGEGYLPGCYEFLAPIQGIEKDASGNFDSSTFQTNASGDRIAIIDITTYQLGDYINKVFQIALAILGVISVIMIIIAGVQYMTVESIYGKSDAKQRITSAVSGLLLSLSIFLILNTINPELLEVNFGSKFEDVDFEEGNDGAVQYSSSSQTAQHHIYNYSGAWPPENENFKTIRDGDINSKKTIIPGVYVKNRDCKHVGDACTSLYFDEATYTKVVNGLTKLKEKSGASKIIITGGSEYWLHKSHGPKSTAIDIRSSSFEGNDGISLSSFLTGSSSYPAQCYMRTNIPEAPFIGHALDETKVNNLSKNRSGGIIKKNGSTTEVRSCSWDPSDHWHMTFN